MTCVLTSYKKGKLKQLQGDKKYLDSEINKKIFTVSKEEKKIQALFSTNFSQALFIPLVLPASYKESFPFSPVTSQS